MKTFQQRLIDIAAIVLLAIVLGGVTSLLAWTTPCGAPPPGGTCNESAPINVSSEEQIKYGGLDLRAGLAVAGNFVYTNNTPPSSLTTGNVLTLASNGVATWQPPTGGGGVDWTNPLTPPDCQGINFGNTVCDTNYSTANYVCFFSGEYTGGCDTGAGGGVYKGSPDWKMWVEKTGDCNANPKTMATCYAYATTGGGGSASSYVITTDPISTYTNTSKTIPWSTLVQYCGDEEGCKLSFFQRGMPGYTTGVGPYIMQVNDTTHLWQVENSWQGTDNNGTTTYVTSRLVDSDQQGCYLLDGDYSPWTDTSLGFTVTNHNYPGATCTVRIDD